jgi:23S rRNA pseudouridine2605 synthase
VQTDWRIAGLGDHLAGGRIDDNGPDRRLAGVGGGLRQFQGDAHGAKIMVDHTKHTNGPDAPGQGAPKQDARGQGAPSQDGERVAKALARAGVASRREVERMIVEGRVSLNGKVLDTPAVKVGRGDILTVDGDVVADAEPARVWRYHKPTGLMTTHNDPQGRPTVFEHLPPDMPRVISVTNDGDLARALELPATGLSRRYRARARGHVTQAKLDTLMDGLTVEGLRYGPIEAHLDKSREGAMGANLWITLTLTEGKNREVRKVLEALGLTVNRLIRLSYGPFQLGTLAQGAVEEVGPRVVREQLGGYITPDKLPSGSQIGAASTVATGVRDYESRPPRADRRGPRTASLSGSAAKPAAPTRKADAEGPAKTEYKPGWAKPKSKKHPHAPKSATARPKKARASPEARSPAKRASLKPPKVGAPPPRSSGAHRKGPPKAGGPKPRG